MVKNPSKVVNEVIVEKLHSLLSEVDGRYVRPLNTKLPQRQATFKVGAGGAGGAIGSSASGTGSVDGANRGLHGPPPKTMAFRGLQAPMLGGRVGTYGWPFGGVSRAR